MGYVLIMALVFSQGLYTTASLKEIHRLIKTIDIVDVAAIRLSEQLTEDMFSQIEFERKFVLTGDMDYFNQFQEISSYTKEKLAKLETLVKTHHPQRTFLAKQLYNQYIFLFDKEFNLINNQKPYSVKTYRQQKDSIVDRLNQEMKQLIRLFKSSRDEKIAFSNRIITKVFNFTIIMAGFIIFFAILISLYNTRSITGPISILQKKTKEISEGNFNVTTVIQSPPEIAELDHDFKMMGDRLKELDQLKIDFISHVSHEMRTPLTVIKEASSMLLEKTFKDRIEKQEELSAIIYEECNHLINAVNRILDLSRMEGKMMPYYFEPGDLKQLINKTVSKITPLVERKEIKLKLNFSENIPCVTMDQEKIEQVLENLLANALKYTNDKGVIVIRALIKKNKCQHVEVSVADNGAGIAEKDLNIIFDKFQRIENGKETLRGTGLGLSIAKHIIDSHGGDIWVESTKGMGSIFYFTLPLQSSS